MQITDETLMALADGELDPGTARAVSDAVAADADLTARLRLFTQTRQALRDSADMSRAADPDPLAAMIRAGISKPLPQAAMAANLNRRPWMAAAASIAIAVVGLVWWEGAHRATDPLSGGMRAALDSLPSGATQDLDNGAAITMIASFTAETGTLCREYETARGDTIRVALACHEGATWQERFADTEALDADGYRPASAEAPIDQALARIGAGAPLPPEAEAVALATLGN